MSDATQGSGRLQRLAEPLHRDRDGAVALAALAAVLILVMTGLVLWDSGRAVRSKVDVQTAADSTAYSQAAIDARSMNMLAFTNIAKRTVMGLHNTYWGMYAAQEYMTELKIAQCASCLSSLDPTCWLPCQECPNAVALAVSLVVESTTNWADFAGMIRIPGFVQKAFLPSFGQATAELTRIPLPWGESGEVFGAEVQELDRYQRYIISVTPWWGFAEGVVRGVQNGATMSTSFPAPEYNLTGFNLPNQIETAARTFGHSTDQTTRNDSLPVSVQPSSALDAMSGYLDDYLDGSRSGQILIAIMGVLDSVPLISSVSDLIGEAFYNMETCSPIMPLMGPITGGSLLEMGANLGKHYSNSSDGGTCGTSMHPKGAGTMALGLAVGSLMCPVSAVLPQFREYMSPAYYRGTRQAADQLRNEVDRLPQGAGPWLARSHIGFAYKSTPELQDQSRENLNAVIGKDYEVSAQETGEAPGVSGGIQSTWNDFESALSQGTLNPTLETGGQWALSRAEIVHPRYTSWGRQVEDATGLSMPSDVQNILSGDHTTGAHGPWMWHAGWTAKMRPLAFPDEFENLGDVDGWMGLGGTQLQSYINAMFHDVAPLMIAGAGLMNTLAALQGRNLDIEGMMYDFLYMEKATRGMDNETIQGNPN